MNALVHQDRIDLDPFDRVMEANRIVEQAALDADCRALAHRITARCGNVLRQGPLVIAQWVRARIAYQREAPSVEILQGPRTTLASGVGDCDDLAILWAALCRSCGIRASLAGVARWGAPHELVHAVGYCADNGQHYDVTDDRRYGGARGSVLFTTPPDCYTLVASEEPGFVGFWLREGPGKPYRQVTKAALQALQPRQGTKMSSALSDYGTMLGLRRYPRRVTFRRPNPCYGRRCNPGAETAQTTPKTTSSASSSFLTAAPQFLQGIATPFVDVWNAVTGQSTAQFPVSPPPPPPDSSVPVSGGPSPLLILGGVAVVGGIIYLLVKRS